MRKKFALLKKGASILQDESSLSFEWLNNDQVMKILDSSRNTVKKLRREKVLPYCKIGGKIYYNSIDVQNMFLYFRRYSLALAAVFTCLKDSLEPAIIF